jgi:DNA-3-methyladenine glycosylase II
MADLVPRVGRCTLKNAPDLFPAMIRIIISQQIATKAADAISARVDGAFPRGVTPRSILNSTDEKLRGCGLSGPKQRAMRAVAEAFSSRAFPADRLHRLPDDEVAATLLPIKGVGPWTVDMVLMFVLARPDVLPVSAGA